MKNLWKKSVILKTGVLIFLLLVFFEILHVKKLINTPQIPAGTVRSFRQSPFFNLPPHRLPAYRHTYYRHLTAQQYPFNNPSLTTAGAIPEEEYTRSEVSRNSFEAPTEYGIPEEKELSSNSTPLLQTTMPPAAIPASFSENMPDPFRRIIRSAQFSIQVHHLNKTYNQVLEITDQFSGYVYRSDYSSSGTKEATLVIEIPSIHFNDALLQIEKLGKVVSREISGEDVTEQYVDLKSKIRHLTSVENQFVEILSRATTISDILMVQQKIDQVQGEIDLAKGRLKYLSHVTTMSQITLELVQGAVPVQLKSPSFSSKLSKILKLQFEDSFLSVEHAFAEALTILAIFAVWGLVYLLPILAVSFLVWRIFMKYKNVLSNFS
jgi:hypothetical protein